mmetsp:Transcript_19046/g.36366  ORF Transcript_19046/g.36366 Transcript_19046/m.36366 type:complete len:280 (+) Transcript_19046:138-977(+)
MADDANFLNEQEVRRVNLVECLIEDHPHVPVPPSVCVNHWSEQQLRNYFEQAPERSQMYAARRGQRIGTFIEGPEGRLEADLAHGGGPPELGLVLLHPHPHMGGNMNNNVVQALYDEFRIRPGFCVCRYNSRGVGRSEGQCAADVHLEREDLRAVCHHLRRHEGVASIVIVGYSFGSLVTNSIAGEVPGVVGYVLVSYPYTMAPSRYETMGAVPKLLLMGDKDAICLNYGGLQKYESFALNMPASQSQVFSGVDHFWVGAEHQLVKAVHEWISSVVQTL